MSELPRLMGVSLQAWNCGPHCSSQVVRLSRRPAAGRKAIEYYSDMDHYVIFFQQAFSAFPSKWAGF